MEKNAILELRNRFDKALLSPDLMHEDTIQRLVKDQLLRSSPNDLEGELGCVEDVVQSRGKQVANFLEMLRSASGNSKNTNTHKTPQNDWKIKQDNNQFRVMYREGPQGTPFHTLLVEGHVDGPIDACLCVSWESALFPKWWPQFAIPPFKILKSTSLQKIRIGEEICMVRVKVPWPLSAREAVLHYLELEYFEEDLIIVLLNTVSDAKEIDIRSHGFTSDKIPPANDIVRISVVGGFALQKVNSNKSYFRTIANMDIKLDFVSPTLINFVSRQLIGSGFKLFQKIVASVASGDEDFRKALKEEPMYIRAREGLGFQGKNSDFSKMIDNEKRPNGSTEQPLNSLAEDLNYASANMNVAEAWQPSISEITVEEIENPISFAENQHVGQSSIDTSITKSEESNEKVSVSAEVQWALGVLDRAIAFFQGNGWTSEELVDLERAETVSTTTSRYSEVSNIDSGHNVESDDDNKYSDEGDSFSFPTIRIERVDSSSKEKPDKQNMVPLVKECSRFSKPAEGELEFFGDGGGCARVTPFTKELNGVHQAAEVKADGSHQHPVNVRVKSKRKTKRHRVCCFWLQTSAK